jgi:hypothetical protein
LPPPGFFGQSGNVINITFRAKALGAGQVRFSSGAVLANDGKGSNILESMGSANYTISAKEQTAQDSANTEGGLNQNKNSNSQTSAIESVNGNKDAKSSSSVEYNRPTITSPSNPNQNVWTSTNNVELDWELPANVVGVSYDLNHSPNYDPKPATLGLASSKVFNNIENGIWYFHLKFFDGKKWGSADHYRILIDNERPLPFSINVEQPDAGNWPTLFFKTSDRLSGVLAYEVYVNSLEETRFKIDDNSTADSLKVQLSQLGYGDHTALVKVVDKAGNETDSTIKFRIDPIETPLIKNFSKEVRPSDQFFANGTSLENILVNIYIQNEAGQIVTKTVHSDKNGNWFYLNNGTLSNGRYFVWVEGENINGLKSIPSEKVSFLVSPPVFAVIGTFVINYFTVIVSLLVMIIIIIVSIIYLSDMIRKRLKKETIEVEDVLQKNMDELRSLVDRELAKLKNVKGAADLVKEGRKIKASLNSRISATEKKIMREVKDVEDILK